MGRLRRFLPALMILPAFAGLASSAAPRATVPPSSYQSGLTATPNPIDNSSNLPITGNVSGGRHFRGSIPYNSTTSFGAPLGSTSLDSFLRYSGSPNVQTGYPQPYVPFYSSTGTVTTTLPGYQGVFSPVSPRIAGGLGQNHTGQTVDAMTMMDPSGYQVSSGPRSDGDSLGVQTSPRLRYTPMSTDSGEMTDGVPNLTTDDPLTQRPVAPAPGPLMTTEEYQQRLSQLRQDLERVQANLSQFQQNLDAANAPTPQTVPPAEPRLELYDPSANRQTPLLTPPVETAGQIDDSSTGPGRPDPAVESGTLSALQRIEEMSKRLNRVAKEQSPASEPPAQEIAEPNRVKTPAEAPLPTIAKPDPVTQKRFDEYLSAAQLHMQQGRYDRAADSFRLASVYIPHDPRPHIGKSMAQLAGGDYAGGSVSLAKAIELDAGYALQKVDLVEILGGPDPFVQRISKLQDLVETGNSPQLQLLLAYVYFQMHQVDEARNAIRAVKQAMPSSPAVDALSAAIDPTTAK